MKPKCSLIGLATALMLQSIVLGFLFGTVVPRITIIRLIGDFDQVR